MVIVDGALSAYLKVSIGKMRIYSIQRSFLRIIVDILDFDAVLVVILERTLIVLWTGTFNPNNSSTLQDIASQLYTILAFLDLLVYLKPIQQLSIVTLLYFLLRILNRCSLLLALVLIVVIIVDIRVIINILFALDKIGSLL